MKRTALLIAIVLLASVCITALSYLAFVFSSYEIKYADLQIKEYDIEGNTFTIKVSADTQGEYLYKVLASPNGEPGELVLTFRGGKQPSRAQTPGKATATFVIELPADTTRIVCDGMTVCTTDKKGD